jgi:hypothetical protein
MAKTNGRRLPAVVMLGRERSRSVHRERGLRRRALHRGHAVLHRLLHLLEGTHLDLAHALARDADSLPAIDKALVSRISRPRQLVRQADFAICCLPSR